MELRFVRIGVNIDSITDTDQMKMRGILHNENSLIFGLSFSGETKEVLYFLSQAHKKKAKTVLISSQFRDSYLDYCDEVILVPSLKHLNYGNVISPQFPISILVDIIYLYYLKEDKNKKIRMHDDTLRALDDKDKGRKNNNLKNNI